MTAEELLDWALDNIHSPDWSFHLIMKTYEDKLKSLTKEQVEAIEMFVKLVMRNKFYQGFGAVVRLSTMDEILKTIKTIRNS